MSWRRKVHTIETGEWPERDGRKRALVENPDRAERWAYAEVLRDAGYEVATCSGEHPGGRERCPLIEAGRCELVEGADIVVSTCSMQRSWELLAIHSLRGSPQVVFEASAPELDRFANLADNLTYVPTPVTAGGLLDAVERARPSAP